MSVPAHGWHRAVVVPLPAIAFIADQVFLAISRQPSRFIPSSVSRLHTNEEMSR